MRRLHQIHQSHKSGFMSARCRVISLLVILVSILLFSCATLTQQSADISTHALHPSPIFNFQIVIADGVYRDDFDIMFLSHTKLIGFIFI